MAFAAPVPLPSLPPSVFRYYEQAGPEGQFKDWEFELFPNGSCVCKLTEGMYCGAKTDTYKGKYNVIPGTDEMKFTLVEVEGTELNPPRVFSGVQDVMEGIITLPNGDGVTAMYSLVMAKKK
eukprot:PhF_6_TR5958/c0_g1_i1/m.8609